MNQKNRIIFTIAASITAGFLLTSINVADTEPVSYEQLFKLSYGYIGFYSPEILILTTAKWMMPQFILFLFWGDYLSCNFLQHIDYIKTRTNRFFESVFRIFRALFWAAIIVCLCLFFVTAFVTKMKAGALCMEKETLADMLIYMLYLLFLLFLVNSLNIFLESVAAVGIVLGSQFCMLIMVKGVLESDASQSLYKWAPISQVLFYYKDLFHVFGRSCAVSVLLLLNLFVIFINVMVLRKKDCL